MWGCSKVRDEKHFSSLLTHKNKKTTRNISVPNFRPDVLGGGGDGLGCSTRIDSDGHRDAATAVRSSAGDDDDGDRRGAVVRPPRSL